jgi:hypothetical protein
MPESGPPSPKAELATAALAYHRLPTPGKLSVVAKKPLANQRDLALAYSPGTIRRGLQRQKRRPRLPRVSGERYYLFRSRVIWGTLDNITISHDNGGLSPRSAPGPRCDGGPRTRAGHAQTRALSSRLGTDWRSSWTDETRWPRSPTIGSATFA